MTIKEIYNQAKKELKAVPVEEPEASAQFLLRQALGFSREEFFANPEQEISSKNQKKFQKYLKRRKKHEPVWQIVKKVEFWGMDFFVNQNVLVPRPETELLVQEALKELSIINYQLSNKIQNPNSKVQEINRNSKIETQNSGLKVLDVGTGAGTIAIALAKELGAKNKKLRVYASDISSKALAVAKKNARELKVEKYIKFIKSDLFEKFSSGRLPIADVGFDIITANLPYIPSEDMGGLAMDIHHYEPRIALEGGAGGLVIYEEFLKQLPRFLNPGGMVFCEIGKDQGNSFFAAAKKELKGCKCEIKKDLAGIDRIAIIKA